MPQPNSCFADLQKLEAFIVKNTWLSPITGLNHLDNHCRGRCLQRVPELPDSLRFLILDQQNITEIANEEALANIEMVSLWGNPVCGIYNLFGDWRNYTGKDQYCMKTGSEECVNRLQKMIGDCDDAHVPYSKEWLNCRENITDLILSGTWSPKSCTTCQRNVEYTYFCTKKPGCSTIAYEVNNLCVSKSVINDTNNTCDIAWVDERDKTNSYFSCDTDCLELYPEEESSDCQPGCSLYNDICAFLWNLVLVADLDKDYWISTSECIELFKIYSRLFWIAKGEKFLWVNNTTPSEKCYYLDENKNGFLEESEILKKIPLILRGVNRNQWEQQSCSHC
jgi:hypothetical protein